MKAAAFDYVRAASVEHALEQLAAHGADAKLLAGGQSLVPMMAMRLLRPALLIDIHRLTALQSIQPQAHAVRTGAGVRQAALEQALAGDATLYAQLPLVAQALRWVGHAQTRNRGTGSAFDEVAIRHGDFALASAAAQLQVDPQGICRRASFGAGGVAGVPLVFPHLADQQHHAHA